jgi:hypothetical protein
MPGISILWSASSPSAALRAPEVTGEAALRARTAFYFQAALRAPEFNHFEAALRAPRAFWRSQGCGAEIEPATKHLARFASNHRATTQARFLCFKC